MAISGRRSGGRAAVRLGTGARAARAAERTPWGSYVGGRRPLGRRRQALLLHSLRRPLRDASSEPRDSNPGCVALRDACARGKTGLQIDTDDLPACRVAGRCDNDEKEAVELLAARALRHCLRQGLGSGMQACCLVTAGMAGAVARDGLGTGRAAAAVRTRTSALAARLMCFCRIA